MLRKVAIAASVAVSLVFCFLAAYSYFDMVYQTKRLSPYTTAYVAAFNGKIGIGWHTGTAPLRVIPENDEASVRVRFDLEESNESHDVLSFAPSLKASFPVMNMHPFTCNVPLYLGARETVYRTGLCTWVWTPAIVFALWPLFAFCFGPVRRFRRRRRGLCVKCGYNLTGNTTGVCPECGRAMESK